MKKCSFSIIIKYLNGEVFDKQLKSKYIDDILKPSSVHLSITVLNNSFEDNDDIAIGTVQKMSTINVVKDFVTMFQKNLSNLEVYLNSVNSNNEVKPNSTGHLCNNCFSDIIGIRYQCSICCNYDLCESCEAISEQVHDSSHLFLKSKSPLHYLLKMRISSCPIQSKLNP